MKPVLLLAVAAALAATLWLTDAPATAGKADRIARPTAAMAAPRGFPGLPPLFVENRGQADGRAAFYLSGRDMDVFLTDAGIVYSLRRPGARWAVGVDFAGAAPARPRGTRAAPTLFNFFRGAKSEWRTAVPSFDEVVYRDLWPGIDLALAAGADGLKATWVVRPGADPAAIRLSIRGATFTGLAPDGALSMETPYGEVLDAAPKAFQPGGDEVPAAWAVAPGGASFRLGAYDPSRPLLIDPAVFIYSGCLGGGQVDRANAVAVDTSGNAYYTGWATVAVPAFPSTVGPDLVLDGIEDAFVAKVDFTGTVLGYVGFIGGSLNDEGTGIAVDADGCACVVGGSFSSDFPAVVGPDLSQNGAKDAFVAKVAADGTSLLFAGFIGGSGGDDGYAVALDSAKNVYVAGLAGSTQATFPVTVGPSLVAVGGRDAFAAKVKADGTGLSYCGYIGGTADDEAFGIAVDADTGEAFVAGYTASTEASFPVNSGPDGSANGGKDAFVARLPASGVGFTYVGFLGGAADDVATGIAIDSSNYAYVVGYTSSDQGTFPVSVGPDLTHNGMEDAFVARVLENGTLGYAGYIGGAGDDRAYGVAIDTWGMACVAGMTAGQGFPAFGGPKWTYGGGVSDIFLTRVEWSGSSLETSGFVGSSARDEARGIAASTVSPDLYLAGFTDSLGSGFPGLYGPQLYSSGLSDAWVGRIQVPELIQFSLKKGALKDTTKPLGDSLKASGTFLPIALLPFDPQTMAVRLTFGGDDPKVVDIPAAAPGWKSGKGKHAYKGADVSLKLDFVKGTFAVALFKSDFPSLQENPIRVFVELGGALYGVSGDWTESAKAPGNFKYP